LNQPNIDQCKTPLKIWTTSLGIVHKWGAKNQEVQGLWSQGFLPEAHASLPEPKRPDKMHQGWYELKEREIA
jgi:hypothetical protein